MDHGVKGLDPLLSLLLLVAFISSLFLFKIVDGRPIFGVSGLVASAERSEYDLGTFLKRKSTKRLNKKRFLFSEESIVSMTHRYNGRFDSVIIHWDKGPILDAVIERKFPRSHLPDTPHQEDMFQASLYALALKEKGLSVSSTKIVTIYCLQDVAGKCFKEKGSSCVTCSQGATFSRSFNEKRTVKAIQRLDEIWYRDRRPDPNPSKNVCRICPYSRNGVCNYADV